MARKNALLKFHTIVAASMGADVTSAVTDIRFMDNIAIQLNFTGTPTGTFEIQGSVDHNISDPSGSVSATGNWIPIDLDPVPAAGGTDGFILLDLNQLSFPFIRIFYDRTSGTGTLDAYISGKEI